MDQKNGFLSRAFTVLTNVSKINSVRKNLIEPYWEVSSEYSATIDRENVEIFSDGHKNPTYKPSPEQTQRLLEAFAKIANSPKAAKVAEVLAAAADEESRMIAGPLRDTIEKIPQAKLREATWILINGPTLKKLDTQWFRSIQFYLQERTPENHKDLLNDLSL